MSGTATVTGPATVTEPPAPVPPVRPATGAWTRLRGSGLASSLVALLIGLVAWELVSLGSGRWVPGLADIAEATGSVLGSETLVSDTLTTLRRVLLVWIATVVVGTLVGVAAGFSWRVQALLRPVLAVALAIPDLVYIIMVVLVLGTAETSGLVALVLAISPLVVNVVMNSVMERDHTLDEMARTYRFGRLTYAGHVLWWQLRPAVQAGTRTAFAFSWKLMVLMEGITTSTGVGARIMEEFRYLRPAEMIVYALMFTVLMKAIEWMLVERLLGDRDRHGGRPAAA